MTARDEYPSRRTQLSTVFDAGVRNCDLCGGWSRRVFVWMAAVYSRELRGSQGLCEACIRHAVGLLDGQRERETVVPITPEQARGLEIAGEIPQWVGPVRVKPRVVSRGFIAALRNAGASEALCRGLEAQHEPMCTGPMCRCQLRPRRTWWQRVKAWWRGK